MNETTHVGWISKAHPPKQARRIRVDALPLIHPTVRGMKRHAGAGTKFNEEQMQWLQMIRDHVISSFHFERDDLEMAPFDSQGGLGKMYQLFGADMDKLVPRCSTWVIGLK